MCQAGSGDANICQAGSGIAITCSSGGSSSGGSSSGSGSGRTVKATIKHKKESVRRVNMEMLEKGGYFDMPILVRLLTCRMLVWYG